MSRFEEVVNDAIGEVILGESAFRAETLAQHIAEKVRDRQDARRAEVTSRRATRSTSRRPRSGILTQEIYTLHGVAVGERGRHAPAHRRHRAGHDRVPVRADARAGRLARAARSPTASTTDEIERIFDAVPVATHNQRGLGTLHVGCPRGLRRPTSTRRGCSRSSRTSMSSEIYELMKRSDEGAVVEKAHRRPRFVEDCVREMIRGVVDGLPELGDDSFVSARQENLETIHQHNVVAERFGLLGELRHELRSGEHSPHHVAMREWLDGLGLQPAAGREQPRAPGHADGGEHRADAERDRGGHVARPRGSRGARRRSGSRAG